MRYHCLCACFSDWREELRNLSSSIDTHAPVPTSNMINVVRGTEFECFKRAFRRTNFDSKKRLDVRFVDADENTEGAADNGGPTREFLRLLLFDIFTSSLFEGSADSKELRLSTRGELDLLPCHM